VQFEFVGEGRPAEQAAQFGGPHPGCVGQAHVAGNDGADIVDQVGRRAEAFEDGAGDVGPDGRMVFKAPTLRAIGQGGVLGGGRFADIVQQDGQRQAQRRAGRQGVEHELRMGEDIAFGMELGRLFDAGHALDLGQDFLQKSGIAQELEGLSSLGRFGQQAEQFIADAFGADAADLRGQLLDRGEGGRFEGKAEGGGKPDRPQQAQVVLGKTPGRVADGADDPGLQIRPPVDEISDFPGIRIEEQRVDGEVAAEGVCAGVGERDGFGTAPVGVRRVGAIAGDFDGLAYVGHDGNDAERLADGEGLGKERLDLFGPGIGGDIPVLGFTAQQEVADATADQICFMTLGPQGVQNIKRRRWNGSRHQ